MTPGERSRLAVGVMAVALLLSAIASVYAKHSSRKLFVELQGLVNERDRLEMDWGRLQIELSTQGNHARGEQLARDRLAMHAPDSREVELVAR